MHVNLVMLYSISMEKNVVCFKKMEQTVFGHQRITYTNLPEFNVKQFCTKSLSPMWRTLFVGARPAAAGAARCRARLQ